MTTSCYKTEVAGFNIELLQNGPDDFCVLYGSQVTHSQPYSEAAKELGLAMMHALACEGKLDNSEA